MICHKTRPLAIPVVVVLWAALGLAQTSISAAEAKNHVGERANCLRGGSQRALRGKESRKSDVHQSR
jgi:hypothetical protein